MDYDTDRTAGMIVCYRTAYNAMGICKEFDKLMASLDAEESLLSKNTKVYPVYARVLWNSSAHTGKPACLRRMMFCRSGYLPHRIRKKRKDR